MPTPTAAASNDTLVSNNPEGVQGSPAVAALGLGYGTVSAWNDLAAGVVRLQVGTPGNPAQIPENLTLAGGGGTATGAPVLVGYGDGAFEAVWAETLGGVTTVYRQELAYNTDVGGVDLHGPAVVMGHGANASFTAVDLPGGDHVIAVSDGSGVTVHTLSDDGTNDRATAVGFAGAGNLSLSATGEHSFALALDRPGGVVAYQADTLKGTSSALDLQGSDPAVTTLTDGRVALARVVGGHVHVSFLDAAGHDLGGEVTVPGGDLGQGHPAILGLADGGFVVGWTENAALPEDRAVIGQRYDGAGVRDGGLFPLGDANSPTGEDNVAFVSLGKGVFGTVFETDSAYGDDDRSVSSSTFTYTIPTKGTEGDDVIQGTAGQDDIAALGGNDVIYGHGGGDAIDGGAGNDMIWGSAPGEAASPYPEMLHGGTGNDEIHGSDGGSKLFGEAGDDTIYGGAGADEIHTGTGADVVFAGGGDDMVYVEIDGKADRLDGGDGGYYGDLLVVDMRGVPSAPAVDIDGTKATLTFSDGTTATGFERLDVNGSAFADHLVGMDQRDGSYSGDYLRGGAGDDFIDGRAGDDNLEGGAGKDTVYGGSGDDVITLLAGDADIVDGGAGTDKLRINAVDAAGAISAIAIVGDLSGPTGTLQGGATISGIENVEVSGSSVADDLKTGAGDDFIRGNGGDDHFSTGAGNDWIDGGLGADVIDAGAGNDTIVVTGGEGGDQIDGGAGDDLLQLNFYDSKVPLVVDASGSAITLGDGTRAVNVERVEINASNLDDVIRTGASNDVISGRDGNDFIDSGAGDDRVSGGTGDNTIRLGAGNDQATVYLDTGRNDIDGGDGYDTLDVNVADINGAIALDLVAGTMGGGGTVRNIEAVNVYGSNGKVDVVLGDGADVVYGSGLADRIVTGGGIDRIYGGRGDDYIDGGAGGDQISAGEGDDTIVVQGDDYIDGEAGNDLARFSGKWSDYTVAALSNGNVTLRDASGTATLANVERFAFADGEVSLANLTKGPDHAGPVARNDAPAEFSEDAALVTGSLTANDTASTAVTAAIVTSGGGLVQSLAGAYGTLRIASDNSFSYVPGDAAQALAGGVHAKDVFTYRITDANGLASDATLTLSIAGANDAPVVSASTEVARGTEDATVRGQLLAGTDAERDALTYSVVAGSVSHGTLELDANTGAYAFTPDKDWNGTTGFSYTLGDGQDASRPKLVTVAIDPVNDAPLASPGAEAARGSEDVVLRGQLLAGTDVDGDKLSYAVVAGSAKHGSVTVDAATGAYAFTGDKDYNGAAEFAYTVSDGKLTSAAKVVAVSLDAVNDAPVPAGAPETAGGPQDAVIRGRLLPGTDVDGDAVSYYAVLGSAQHGSVVIDAATGVYAFTPDAGYRGPAAFSYSVSDGTASGGTKLVSLSIAPVNQAPVAAAAPETARGSEDVVLKGQLLAGTDVDGDTLSYAVVDGSARHGTVALDAKTGAYAFTADKDYNGAAEFAYTVSDGKLSSAPKSVALTFDPVNDAPVAALAPETGKGFEDVVLKGQLLAGTDVDGDKLSYAVVAGSAKHGSVTVDAATGAYAFTADRDYNGAAEFAYTVSDGKLTSAAKAVAVTLDAVNDAPAAATAAESGKGTEDVVLKGQLLAGTDVDGDKLTYGVVAGSAHHGTVAIDAATGAYAFTADRDYNGAADFAYTVSDGKLTSVAKVVGLTFAAVNDAPVASAVAETGRGKEDAVLRGQLLAGADVDGDALTYALVSGSAHHGTVTVDAKTGAYAFTPDKDYNGAADFSYTVSDGLLSSAAKTVSLGLDAVNDAPVLAAAAEAFRLTEDTPFSGHLLQGTDVDGDRLTFELVAGPGSHGQVSLDAATGAFTYRPDADFNGAAELHYRLFDGQAYSAERVVGLTVDAVNDAPVARDDAGFVAQAGKATTILASALLANDADVDGDRLALAGVSDAKGGTVALDADGNVVFTATAGYAGAASFSYLASDGHGGTDTGGVSLTVQSATAALPLIEGTDRNDVLRGSDKAEAINAKAGADVVFAGGGDDVVHGNAGNDVLNGEGGHDKLYGDAGDDLLFGGDGNDLLNGGAGGNILTGGSGRDTFVFEKGTGANIVTDFQVNGGDVLDVSGLGFHNLAEVKAAIHEVKAFGVTLATIIDGPGTASVSLALVKAADLKADDFLFA